MSTKLFLTALMACLVMSTGFSSAQHSYSPSHEKVEAASTTPTPASVALRATEVAKSYLFVRETSPNRSVEIDRFNRTAGAPVGSYWCMSYVYTSYQEAAQSLGVPNPLLRTASVARQLQYAARIGSGLQVLRAGRVGATYSALPGDVGCISSRGTDDDLIGGSWLGHGFIVYSDAGQKVRTREGNSNNDGSRNGYRVVERLRDKSKLLAAIRKSVA